MTTDAIILRIVLVLTVMLAAGELYLFSVVHARVNALATPSTAFLPTSGLVASTTPAQDVLKGIQVGDMAVAYQGTINRIQNGQLQVKTPEKTITFILSSDTKFTSPGTQKSYAEFNQEMTAYNAKVVQLMQDPVKNAAALKALVLPLQFNQNKLTLSDFKIGDYVFVTVGSEKSVGLFTVEAVALANTTSASQ